MLVSLAVAIPWNLDTPLAAHAGTPLSGFSTPTTYKVHGNYILVGNSVLDCPANSTKTGCGAVFNGGALASSTDDNEPANDQYNMRYTGGGTLLNSSSATLTVPSGATVTAAKVYWAGDTGGASDGTTNTCGSGYGGATLPSGSPKTTNVSVTANGSTVSYAPGSTYYSDTGSSTVSSGAGNYYAASADITAQFNPASPGKPYVGDGNPLTITVGNIWTPQGYGCMGGWSLQVIYDYGKFVPGAPADANGNNPSQLRTLYSYDGYARESQGDGGTTISISGLQPQGNGSTIGTVAYEGDIGVAGDNVTYSDTSTSQTQLSSPAGNSNNYFVSYAQGAKPFNSFTTGKYWYNGSVDASSSVIPLVAGDTNLTLDLGTDADSYLLQHVIVSVPNADVQITKTATNGEQDQAYAPGATPSFRITLYNSGSVPIRNLAITDAQASGCARTSAQVDTLISATNSKNADGYYYLPAGASVQYTCQGPAVGALAGYDNTAAVVGETATKIPVQSSNVSRALVAHWVVSKSPQTPDVQAGKPTSWTIKIVNDGTAPIFNVAVNDPSAPDCARTAAQIPLIQPAGIKNPDTGEVSTGVYSYNCTGATAPTPADGNSVSNSISATAYGAATKTSANQVPLSVPGGTTTGTQNVAAISVVKKASASTASVGDTVNFTLTVNNLGSAPINSFTVSDPNATCTLPSSTAIPKGGSATVQCQTIPFTSASKSQYTNTATVTALPPSGQQLIVTSNTVTVDNKALQLVKTAATTEASGDNVLDAGDKVTYSFQVTNNGSVPLTNVTAADKLLPGLSCTPITLAVGATATLSCTGNVYTVTVPNVDAQTLTNTATATGTAPDNTTTSANASVTLTPVQQPKLDLSKTVSPAAFDSVGQTLTYTFNASNSGNTTMSNVTLTDALNGLSNISCVDASKAATALPATLAPGATLTCTATYTTKQADLDAGQVVNNATLTGKSPVNTIITKTASATATVNQKPHLTLSKSADTTNASTVGQTVKYTYSAKNDGNVTLSSVNLVDDLDKRLAGVTCSPTLPATLAPGATVTCTGNLTVTQDDLDAGSITNTVSATANTPKGATYTATPVNYVVTPQVGAAISVTKTASVQTVAKAGDKITYTIKATNGGKVTLDNVNVTDTDLTGLTLSCNPAQGSSLAPGSAITCTGTYSVTQKDIDQGVINNVANASGTGRAGKGNVSGSGSAQVTVNPTSSIGLTKVADRSQTSSTSDVTTYTLTATNTGSVTVNNVRIADPLPGLTMGTCTPAAGSALAPAATMTCKATRTTTLADLNAGLISNTSTATGTTTLGTAVSYSASAQVVATQSPSFTVAKSANPTSLSAPGNIGYTVLIQNNGNVTLKNLRVTDPKLPNGLTCAPVALNQPLDPGQSTQCTGTYLATQSDIDAGSINNTATATLTPPTGADIVHTSSATVTSARQPQISANKTASVSTYTKVGDQITYQITGKNVGNVTLTGVTVTDPMFPSSNPLACTWPTANPAGTLAPGDIVTCTGTRAATQNDLDTGSIQNTVTVKGTGPSGTVVQDSKTATVNAVLTPGMSLTKTANPASITAANSTITYTLTAKNTGNVTLKSMQISDPRLPTFSNCSPALGSSVAPGGTMTCTGSYTSTQADVDAGSITNTATVNAQDQKGAALTPVTAGAVVPVTQKPQLTLAKSAAPNRVSKVGDQVTYSFLVTNSGNVTANNIAVTDTFSAGGSGTMSAITCPVTTLAPNQNTTCTATYTANQADLNVAGGKISNTATVNATDTSNKAFPAATSSTDVTVNQTPQLGIQKTASPTSVSAVGTDVSYTITVTNTGNTDVTNVAPSDNLIGTLACSPASGSTLAPGAQMTCSATRKSTQVDLDAGGVTNTASVTGNGPNGNALPKVSSQAKVTATQQPSMSLQKTADQTHVQSVGQTINYSYLVTNTGNVTIGSLNVTDPMQGLSAISCPKTSLAPTESTTCTAHYSVTLKDLNTGSITNTGTATATGPGGTTVPQQTSSAVVIADRTQTLSITKSASQTTYGLVGATITYTYNVQNTGNTTIGNVNVTDAMPNLSQVNCNPAQGSSLDPTQTMRCTATYTVTQADIDARTLSNTGVVTGTGADGKTVTASSPLTINAFLRPALTLNKTANPTQITAPNQTITYSFVVNNTGNTTLSNVGVQDTDLPGLSQITCPSTTVAPKASVTCTATYTTTQADVDRGSIANSATANGTDPAGTVVTGQSSTTVQAPQSPALSLTKSVSPGTYDTVGQTLTYTYHVQNTGNVTMNALAIVDPHTNLSSITCPVTQLAPGATTDCTATYAVTLADLNNGQVDDTAHATANNPAGSSVSSNDSTASAKATQNPQRTFTKTANPTTVSNVGDIVTYTLSVHNTGNVTLGSVYIADPPLQAGNTWQCTITDEAGNTLRAGNGPVALNPREIKTCKATYVTTQADLDAGSIVNNATTTANDSKGNALPSEAASATVQATQSPAITFSKTADTTVYQTVGQKITYTFTLTNSGNTSLSNAQISDPHQDLSALSCTPALGSTLAPKAAMRCTATYAVTQADIDARSISNTATATAQPPSGAALSQTRSVTIPVQLNSSIDLSKSGSPSTVSSVGQTVTYSFVVKNTGNSTLNNIAVTDPHAGLSAISCPTTTLAPQASTTCTATYAVTQADLDANSILNTASVAGTDAAGTTVTKSASATVQVQENPTLTLTKTASPTTVSKAGDQVTYTFVVSNQGNTTVNQVQLTDPTISANPLTCPQNTLAPGTSMTCTATYTVDQQDVDLGQIVNKAAVTGTTKSGTAVQAGNATATVTVQQNPAMTLDKTADTTTVTKIGQTVTYTLTASNTGNTSLSNVFISDPPINDPSTGKLFDCYVVHTDGSHTAAPGPVTLAPGEQKVCHGSKTFTQADFQQPYTDPANQTIDFPNTGTVNAADPHGTALQTVNSNTVHVTLKASPDFKVIKSANSSTFSYAGQVITYQVSAQNTGNVDLANVQVIDDKLKNVAWSCSPALGTTLAPGQQMNCSAQYTVTQDDINAQSITNNASGQGTDPQGQTHLSTSPGSWVLTLDTSNSGMTLSKVGNPGSITKAGDQVTFTLTAYNSGSVDLTNLAIVDNYPGVSAVSCPSTYLGVGQRVDCTATYTATQADIDSHGFTNTATATAQAGENTVTANGATKIVSAYAPAITLKKAAQPEGGKTAVDTVGDVIDYTFTVNNTGNVPLQGIAITDRMSLTGLSCPATTLAAGGSMTCTAKHTVTQDDLNASAVTNNATVNAQDADNDAVSATATASVPTSWKPGVTLSKSVNPATVSQAGTTVTYTVAAVNTGNVSLYSTFIADPLQQHSPNALSKFTCRISNTTTGADLRDGTGPVTLNPNETKTCTATYTVSQADVDAGSVPNTANVTTKLPDSSNGPTATASAVVTSPAAPALTATKSVDTQTFTSVGQQLTYSYTVTNSGNVTLYNVTPNDTLYHQTPGDMTATVGNVSCSPSVGASLAPGAVMSCSATYQVTQADLDAGTLKNNVNATGTISQTATQPAATSNTASVTSNANTTASATIAKRADASNYDHAGQVITYSFDVRNNGTATLHTLNVSDVFTNADTDPNHQTGTGTASSVTCPNFDPAAGLAPNATTTCQMTYTVTQDDIDHAASDGSRGLANTATVTGADALGNQITPATSSLTIPVAMNGEISLTKTPSRDTVDAVGQTITYTFVVTNTGNVKMQDGKISDAMQGMGPISCDTLQLEPGAQATCTASVTVTQDMLNSGTIGNTATAVGNAPDGSQSRTVQASANVKVNQQPKLTLTKAADKTSVSQVGETVTYTVVATNTGNVTLANVFIADPLQQSGMSKFACVITQVDGGTRNGTGPVSLAPGEIKTCTATYKATQNDINTGTINNTAHVDARDAEGNNIATVYSNPVVVTANQSPSLSVAKSVDSATYATVGQQLTYTMTVTNTGNTTLSNVQLTDKVDLTNLNCTPALGSSLDAGKVMTCTGTHAVTQADIDALSITNVASAQGTAPGNQVVSGDSNPAVSTAQLDSRFVMIKHASPQTVTAAGDVVTYTFDITNEGNSTLHDIAVSDPMPGLSAINCGAGPISLAPQQSVECTATYTVTQADIDNAKPGQSVGISNTATATAADPAGTVITRHGQATVQVQFQPALTVTKTPSVPTVSKPGDPVRFSIVITNSGNVALKGLTLSDSLAGTSPVDCGQDLSTVTLEPNASITCTTDYVAKQSDIDAGTIRNTASATGQTPDGSSTAQAQGDATVTVNQTPSMSLDKSSNVTTVNAVGDEITYTVVMRNTGNTTLTNVFIADPMQGTIPQPNAPQRQTPMDKFTCTITAVDGSTRPGTGPVTVAPGETKSCTASYRVEQSDLDAGTIPNQANVTSTAPNGSSVKADSNPWVVTAVQSASIELQKSVTPLRAQNAGDTLTYTFLIRNTGTVTLSNVALSDQMAGLSAYTCDQPLTSLAPGKEIQCTATKQITAAEMNQPTLDNTATVTATAPTNPATTVTSQSSAEVIPVHTPKLTIVKRHDVDAVKKAGDKVTFFFDVTNSGNIEIANVGVQDQMLNDAGVTVTCPQTTLAVGASTTCQAVYTATQADVDRGRITNTATTTGIDPIGGDPVVQGQASDQVPVTQSATLAVKKTPDSTAPVKTGDSVPFTILVTNTGNVTVSNVQVADTNQALTSLTCDPTQPATLAPQGTMTCKATVTATQDNFDFGSVDNHVDVTGTDPNQAPVPVASDDASVPTQPGTASMTLTKTPDKTSVASVGEKVTYTFKGTNTGTYTLFYASITDPLPNLSSLECDRDLAGQGLAPGDTVTCTASYTVTQDDLNNGGIDNTATFSAEAPPNFDPISTTATAHVTATQQPALAITKTADRSQISQAGDVINYTFNVRNTGNVAVGSVTINDPMVTEAITCQQPDGTAVSLPASLAPGASITCKAPYTVTQGDMDAGSVTNTATASGKTGLGQAVDSLPSSAATVAQQTTGVTVTKSADVTQVQKVGDVVTYTIKATNTSNVTLHNATITDPLLPNLTCTPGAPASLAPNATLTCTGTYSTQHTDLEAGKIANTASFTSLDPNGKSVDGNASYTVTAIYDPKMEFIKGVSESPITTSNASFSGTPQNWIAGDTITYTYHIENVGNMLANHVRGVDSMAGLSTLRCYAPQLQTDANGNVTGATPWMGPEVYLGDWMAPGEYVDCIATYKATQADVNRGYINNTATLDADEATGQAFPTVVSSATTDTDQQGSISLTKDSSTQTFKAVGDKINYSFTVTNTSHVTVDSIAITDPLPGISQVTCPPVSLDPGQYATCTASYTVTQADLDRGYVDNSATASARAPKNVSVRSAAAARRVGATQQPSLSQTKDSQTSQISKAGEHVTFHLTTTNTGNVTASKVDVKDKNPNATITSCDRARPATLKPGETLSCTVDYVVTQDEIDAGGLSNLAEATGETPQGAAIAAADAVKAVTSVRSPQVTLSKTPSTTTVDALGQQITYTFVAKNTGNTTLTNVSVTDPMPGLSALACDQQQPGTLAPDQSMRCTATYATTLADMNKGSITNVASVTGLMINGDPNDPTAHAADTQDATVKVDRQPALTLDKKADVASVGSLSDTITYTFTVTNTGNETVQDIVVADPLSASGLSQINCPTTTLDPTQTMTCTATYRPTQIDLDRGYIPNTATADGVDVVGNHAKQGVGSARVEVAQQPADMLTKSADHSAISKVGEWVQYTYIGRSTGNVTLHVVTVADPMQGLVKPDPDNLNKPGTEPGLDCYPRLPANLPPGDQVICRAYYQVTQADLDRGYIYNLATLNAQDPGGKPLPEQTASKTIYQANVEVTKSSTTNQIDTLGQQVPYTIHVNSTGGAGLDPVVVDDPMFTTYDADHNPVSSTLTCTYDNPTDPAKAAADPLHAILDGTGVTASSGNGTSMTCTGTHVVTQSDLDGQTFNSPDHTQVVNPVTVNATPLKGPDGSAAAPISATTQWPIAIAAKPSLAVDKVADVATVKAVGDPINYTITVKNSGNVTVRGATITDQLAGISALTCTPAANPITGGADQAPTFDIAPGDTVTCTATYAATQADLDRGTVTNSVSASGTGPASSGSLAVNAQHSVDVAVTQSPSLALKKTVDPAGPVKAGAVLTYTFTVTNTGNVTADGVLNDPLPGLSTPTCDAPLTRIAPGATVTCHATYTVTQADVDSGSILNTATISTVGPQGQPGAGDTASTTTAGLQQPALTLTKTASIGDQNGNGKADLGETVTYTLTARNTGTVTITGVKITDPMLPQLSCTPAQPATLAPGESMVCTGTHVVTDAESRGGTLVNKATVTGTAIVAGVPTPVTGAGQATVDAAAPVTPAPPAPGQQTIEVTVVVSTPPHDLANTGAPWSLGWVAFATSLVGLGMMFLFRRSRKES